MNPMVLINLGTLVIVAMSVAYHESVTAIYERLPVKGKVTLIVVPALILTAVIMANMPGAW